MARLVPRYPRSARSGLSVTLLGRARGIATSSSSSALPLLATADTPTTDGSERHGQALSSFGAFTTLSGSTWRADWRRVQLAGRTGSASKPGATLAGSPVSTITLDFSAPLGERPAPIWTESDGAGNALAIETDHLGRLRWRVSQVGQPDRIATWDRPVAPRWTVASWSDLGLVYANGLASAGGSYDSALDGDQGSGLKQLDHRRYRFTIKPLHPTSLEPIDVGCFVGNSTHGSYLAPSDSTPFKANGQSFAFVGWFRADSTASASTFVTKWSELGSDTREYQFLFRSGKWAFFGSDTGDSGSAVAVESPTTVVAGQWYLIAFGWDATNGNLFIQVIGHDSAPVTQSISGLNSPSGAGTEFRVGGRVHPTTLGCNGRIDNLAFLRSSDILSSVAALVEAVRDGDLHLADATADQISAWGGVSAWGLDEPSGTRADAWGSNDLAVTGTVSRGDPAILRGIPHDMIPGDEVTVSGKGWLDGTWEVTDVGIGWVEIVGTNTASTSNTTNTQINPTTIGARSMTAASGSDLTSALSLRFDADWSGGDWTLSGWFRQDSTGIDGAGILCASPIGDARATGTRVELVYQSGYVVARIPGTALEVEVGPAIQDQWHHYALVHDSAAQTLTPYFDGEPYDLRSDRSTSTNSALRLGDTPWILAARVTPDRLDIDQVLYASGTDVRLRWVAAAQQYRLDVDDGIASSDGSTVDVNGSFETPVLPTNTFKYLGTNENWGGWVRSYTGAAVSNGVNAFTTSTVYSQLDGQQCLILQNLGAVYRDFEAPDPANYTFQFWTIRRGAYDQTLKVFLDGVQLGADIIVGSSAKTVSRTFSVPAGTHRIEIKGMRNDVDTSAYIDRVVLTRNSVNGTVRSVSASPVGGQAVGVAHDVIAAYDPVTEEISLRIDGGAPVTTGGVTAVAQTATSVGIGCNHDGSSSFWGALDPIALHRSPPNWSTALAAVTAEFDGAGPGPTYAGLGGSYAADTGLVAWYEGTPGSTRVDSHSGGYDLTNTTIRIGGPLDLSGSSGAASVWSGIGIGFNQSHTARFACSFDGIGLWLGRALAGPDVAALFGEGPAWAGLSSGSRLGIWSFYNCDERGGDLLDASGNGNHLIKTSGAFKAVAGTGSGLAFASAPDTVTLRRTGHRLLYYHETGGVSQGDSKASGGLGYDADRHVWTIRRQADGTLDLWCNGQHWGSTAIEAAAIGPTSGVTSTFGYASDAQLGGKYVLRSVAVASSALSDAAALDANCKATIAINRRSGPWPLGVQCRSDDLRTGGTHRSEAAHLRVHWEFTEAGTLTPHTSDTCFNGQGRAYPSGVFCSQVFESPGTYDAWVAVLTPPHTRTGIRRRPAILWSGVFATITVSEWPANTTDIYYDPSAGSNGDGSIGSPYNTWSSVASAWANPYTRIFWKRGTSVAGPLALSGKHGPALIAPYGSGAAPRLKNNGAGVEIYDIDLNAVHDLRVMDLLAKPDTSLSDAGKVFRLTACAGTLVLRCDAEPSDDDVWNDYAFIFRSGGTIFQDCLYNVGVYGFFIEEDGQRGLSIVGCQWSGKVISTNPGGSGGVYHLVRSMNANGMDLRDLRLVGTISNTNANGYVMVRKVSNVIAITDAQPGCRAVFGNSNSGPIWADHRNYGGQLVTVERCDFPLFDCEAVDGISCRDVTIYRGAEGAGSTNAAKLTNDRGVRLLGVNDLRIYDGVWPNGRTYLLDSLYTNGGAITPRVLLDRWVYSTDGASTTSGGIGAVATASGVLAVEAAAPPSGDDGKYLTHRLMACPSGGTLAEVPDRRGGLIVYRPGSSGSYDLRLDAVNPSNSEDVGVGTELPGETVP